MTSTQAPNTRAHLLAGLRTGGVRSASGANVPHTAAPAGTFNIPRYSPSIPSDMFFTEEQDELADMVSQNMYISNTARMQAPRTAAVDGGANRFAQQQQGTGMHGAGPMSPFMSAQAQMQTLQLHMMQMEIARLQTLQAQQYQAELLAQAQAQAQAQRQRQPQRRTTLGFAPPATAGPATTVFDLRSTAAGGAQFRRANQADQLRAALGVTYDDQTPMTAALGGRFGSRAPSGQYESEEDEFTTYTKTPPMPNYTSVISGGTVLGNPNSSPPSKSDAAVSWRRGGNNSVLGSNRSVTSPVVKITPPPIEGASSSPPASSPLKIRPPALRFSPIPSPVHAVAVDSNEHDGDDSSSASSKSGSTPSTPRTASSLGDVPPISPREEASKKLYEGLGMRHAPAVAVSVAPPSVQRLVATPLRQPRGPPSNHDELVPKNFATRSRRKAIGALGALLDAREKREVIEVC